MARVNIGRIMVGGGAAGLICFAGDAVVHGVLLKPGWAAAMAALGRSGGGDVSMQALLYFLVYDLLKGLLALWLYSAMRPRFGPGPATALAAALTVWLLVIPVPVIGLAPMRFFSLKLAALWSLYGLIPIVIGTEIGAWMYREAAA